MALLKFRWPWKYGRLIFQATGYWNDTEFCVWTGPTVWGPWYAPSQDDLTRLKEYARPLLDQVHRFSHYGGRAEVVIRLEPRRKEER